MVFTITTDNKLGVIVLEQEKIYESIISGVCVGLAILVANKIIERLRANKEFQTNLALVIIELYNNYSIVPDCEPMPVKPCNPVIFETSVWDSMKSKLILKLTKPEFTRVAVLYYSLINDIRNKRPTDSTECYMIKAQLTVMIDELLTISKYDFRRLDHIVRGETKYNRIQNVAFLLLRVLKSIKLPIFPLNLYQMILRIHLKIMMIKTKYRKVSE